MNDLLITIFTSLALCIILASILILLFQDFELLQEISKYRKKLNRLSIFLIESERGNESVVLEMGSAPQVCLPFYNKSKNELKRICV